VLKCLKVLIETLYIISQNSHIQLHFQTFCQYQYIYAFLYSHQNHVRFNKLTEYRICHKIIEKYKIYMPYQCIIVKKNNLNKYSERIRLIEDKYNNIIMYNKV